MVDKITVSPRNQCYIYLVDSCTLCSFCKFMVEVHTLGSLGYGHYRLKSKYSTKLYFYTTLPILQKEYYQRVASPASITN